MNTDSPLLIGIAPEHLPALLAALGLPCWIWLGALLVDAGRLPADGRTARRYRGYRAAPLDLKWLTWLLLITAVVHLALPLGHAEGGTGLLFLGSGLGYGWLAMRALDGRRWRPYTVALLVGTLIAYLAVVGTGQEEPDHVGIATALVELLALGLCVIPAPGGRRGARGLASSGYVAGTIMVGAVIWVGMFAAHGNEGGQAAVQPAAHDGSAGHDDGPGTEVTDHEPGAEVAGHGHGHGFTARAQAGVIMRPTTGTATGAQERAAAELADATTDGIAPYRNLRAAQQDGYRAAQPMRGLAVHFENKAYQSDGRILDPRRPEQLVYAIENGRAVLLGAVYQMQRAGEAGPAVGGPITRWHAHNVCVTITPPGFGVVSPFGTCPSLTLTVTMPEMMHVWTIDQPAGPYADDVDPAWARRELARHGRPVTTT